LTMRILHCSDFHANEVWFDWLVDHAQEYDLVCLTGDLLDVFEISWINLQLRMVKAALRRVTTPLAICSGNHDSFTGPPAPPSLIHATWLEQLRRTGLWIDGDAFHLSGHRFRCIGWNASLPTADPGELWLFHAPPARTPVAFGLDESDAGDEILGEMCWAGNGPAMVLSGHQHNPCRWACRVGRTWCLNPGYNRRASAPNNVVIDTIARTVALHIDGQQQVVVHIL
jgi:uncharacterized protein